MRARILLPLVAMALALPSLASASVVVYTNEALFVAALSGPQSLVDFDADPLGPLAGTEYIAQGFEFDPRATGAPGQMEVAPGDFFSGGSKYFNIGERPYVCCDGWDDAVDVIIHGNWQAMGFVNYDGPIPQSFESITFYGDANNVIYQRLPGDGAVSFLGIIADENIRHVFVDEAGGDSDDVGYDNFRLGNQAVSEVPEPSTLLLLGSGLLGVARISRRRA